MTSIRSLEQFWSSDSAQSLTRLWLSAMGGYVSACSPSIVVSLGPAILWTSESQCKEGVQEMTGRPGGGANEQNPEAEDNAGSGGFGDKTHYAGTTDQQADQTLISGILSLSVGALVAR